MVLTNENIKEIIRTNPGDFVIYELSGDRLVSLYKSPGIFSIFGMDAESYSSLIDDDPLNIVYKDDRPYLASLLSDIRQMLTDSEFTFRALHKSKPFIWLRVRGRIIGTLNDNPVLIVSMLDSSYDASEYATLMDDARTAIYVISKDTFEILYANKRILEKLDGDFPGQLCHKFFMGLDQPCPWCYINRTSKGQFHADEMYLPDRKKWFAIDCKDINWFGVNACAVYLNDITVLKETLLKHEKTRQLYMKAASLSKLILWEYDISTSDVFMQLDNEYTKNVCVKMNIPEVLHNVPESLLRFVDKEDREAFIGVYDSIKHGAPAAACEMKFKMTSFDKAHYERITANTIYNADGQPVGAHFVGQNITEDRLKEEQYQSVYSQLSKANPNAIGYFRMNLTKNLCAHGESPYPYVIDLADTGTVDGFFSRLTDIVIGDKKKEEFRKRFKRTTLIDSFLQGKTRRSITYSVLDSSGSLRWIYGTINMVQNPISDDIEGILYGTDVTEQMKTQDIIMRITENKYDFLGIINPKNNTYELRKCFGDTEYYDVNESKDYNAMVNEVLCSHVTVENKSDFMMHVSLENICKALEKDNRYFFTFSYADSNGVSHSKQLSYEWLDETHTEIISMQTDITELRKIEQERLDQLQRALYDAEAANRSKIDFISRISHDIRTPMNAISSMTSFAIEDMDDPVKLKTDLEKIQASNEFLMSLINDILDISKLDSGKTELHPEPYPYSEYSANITNLFAPLCAEKNLSFTVKCLKNDGIAVMDKTRINQIVLNLVSNAVKYTAEGGAISIDTSIRRLSDALFSYDIFVSDTGIGMSKEFQKTMFDPFTQEYNSSTHYNGGGTGLGLSIVKKLVDLMGGTIEVSSELGKGTCFRVHFIMPEASSSYVRRYSRSDTARLSAESVKLHGKVLLCEDNEINTEIALRILSSFGLEVDCAEDGNTGYEMFEKSEVHEYSAVLMDIQMPLMNGYEATKKIRACHRCDAASVPIIAMTADAFDDAMDRCMEAGMNDHLTKPLDPSLLKRTLIAYMN